MSTPVRSKLIYNPHAGKKHRLFHAAQPMSLDILQALTKRYEMNVDFFATKGPRHAMTLAKESEAEGYDTVIVAGGDGTVGEAVNGLIGSKVQLAILPFGTYMNVGEMLAIPHDLDAAMLIIKMGRTRKIDVGSVNKIDGEIREQPYYFLESVGIGLDAQFQEFTEALEHGQYRMAWHYARMLFNLYRRHVTLVIDEQTITTRAGLIVIANGPLTGPGLKLAPESKLNDHKLSVALYGMTRFEFLKYFYSVARHNRKYSPLRKTFQAKKVTVTAHDDRPVHADARLFGTLPVSCTVVPEAVNVIVGFPTSSEESGLKKERIYLAP